VSRLAAGTYARIAELPLEIESFELERLELVISPEFTRVTTVIHLRGGGEEGVGEDVTYGVPEQTTFQVEGPGLPLAGSRTLEGFSELLDTLELFAEKPAMPAYRDYRRWALESAALDLALRQAGLSLAETLGREPRPVQYVASMRLGEPASLEPLQRWLEVYPELRFKLDPTGSWTEEVVAALAALGKVDVFDLKGQYKGTVVDQPPDPDLYARVVEGFPDAWIEDPALTPETDRVLEPHRDRVTWDAPIHSVDDVLALPFAPRMLNVKPSRFGPLRRLFDFYDWCAANDVRNYGGGQFELGPGRGQIQYLASLFHPDAPNDVAPAGFNAGVQPGLPTSPLRPPSGKEGGFRLY
jgi:L-alanine-DL-glutamate epimerase-like enolase superfamily enzyme